MGALNRRTTIRTTPLIRVGLATIVALILALAMLYWPHRGAPESPDMQRRLDAISQLVDSTDQASLDTLVKLASDPELRVAKASIRAIGHRRDEPSRLVLKQLVSEHKSGELRGTAATELGRFKETDYRLLTAMLLEDKDPKARAGAARGLKLLHNSAAVDSLLKALGDTDADVRAEAFRALGRCTGRWFEFDPNASLEARSTAIEVINDELTRIKSPNGH
ncbi:MAG: HEAT repeat domain-containing protein [Phycisphaerales bacterium]|nr:HEAT repeat domain-containing protein [Phycisphaerales bacterium]